ncbi:MAG: glycosyltransferase family protein [Pseudohongiella sp.]|nr:glycosyltransferase family protein [Pseudohongiella sp.]MDO9520288.1 glycosyltransferase family protein [Pseudohongiella sp.]MDP2127097.1 glycosyltransferase family protein [Pseudohongiella sp.]
MKVLFGVQGTGNGHISRARAMAPALREQDIEVDFLFSGRPADRYFDMDIFGNYDLRTGLSFVVKNGCIDYWQTMRQAKLLSFWREVNKLDLSAYDLVLTDFEPVTAWAAKRAGKPSIGISRQYAFHYDIPKVKSTVGDLIFSRYAPATVELGCHWHHFGQPLLPPIVEKSPYDIEPDSQMILVYLPFENLQALINKLKQLPAYRFEVYHPEALSNQTQDNVHIYKPGRKEFQRAMARCGGVIGNAGFELASEALQTGAPLLVKPLHGQVEQLSNVMNLKLLGLAESMDDIDLGIMSKWLQNRHPKQVIYPDVASEVASWIARHGSKSSQDNLEELSAGLWKKVEPIIADNSLLCDNQPPVPAVHLQTQHG